MSVALALLVVGMSASAAADVPPPHVQAARLIAHDGQARDRLGFAVALDGDTLAVGAPNATVGDAPAGALSMCTFAAAPPGCCSRS